MTRSKSEIVSRLCDAGIVAIIRIPTPEQIPAIFEALLAGGISAIEITMTTPNALEAIRQACERFGDQAVVGVGTVANVETCRGALKAGAEFVVTPICRTELVAETHAAQRPIMLGAYTPTEAQTAYEAGADFIKIFPADTLGPGYMKALRAPLPHLRLVPTGGVDARNITDFLNAGCAAVGIGSSLVSAKLLQDANWPELTRKARDLVEAARTAVRR